MLVASAACAQTPIERIRANVAKFEAPDFVCHERITSLRIGDNGGEVEKETTIESTVTGRRQKERTFVDRRIESVDGVAWKKKSPPRDVFLADEEYASLLSLVFGPGSSATYSMEDGVITFRLQVRVKAPNGSTGSEELPGRAWFDPVTFEIKKIEESVSNGVSLAVEYQPARIGDATYWMPWKVSAVAQRTGSKAEYSAEYSDYRALKRD